MATRGRAPSCHATAYVLPLVATSGPVLYSLDPVAVGVAIGISWAMRGRVRIRRRQPDRNMTLIRSDWFKRRQNETPLRLANVSGVEMIALVGAIGLEPMTPTV